tara:strand:+ start:1157 stop:1345 length:189 start_codon:yes stop_codon:yes gene_type:complete
LGEATWENDWFLDGTMRFLTTKDTKSSRWPQPKILNHEDTKSTKEEEKNGRAQQGVDHSWST